MLKVYVVYGGHGDMDWMECLDMEQCKTIEDADIVLFTGGADVSPHLYGEKSGKYTYDSPDRQITEIKAFDIAVKAGKMMVGQCRGGQLLCVLAGGKLIQDVTHHAGIMHKVNCFDGDTYSINSIHHQMQFPFTLPTDAYKILSWSKGISSHYLGEHDQPLSLPENFVEPEAVHYPKIKSLSFQGHPEWMNEKSYGRYKCRVFLKTFVEETLQIKLPEIPDYRTTSVNVL